jgi:hypothetical protein
MSVGWTYGQTQTTAYATKYFLPNPPAKGELAHLPSGAQDVVIARARLSNGFPILLVGRDQSGRPSPFVSKSLFRARIERMDVVSGDAKRGRQIDVYFGTPGKRSITPRTPETVAREHFVVIFHNNENEYQLLGFPASREEYGRWEVDWLAYEQKRDRPGSHD